MTDEEKAIKALCVKCSSYDFCVKGNQLHCAETVAYIKGFSEGRKDGYEQGKNNERELQCGKKNYEKDIAKLEKENARLSKMLEMAINEVLLCGKQMKVEHPSMLIWTEETFRAELEERVREN